MLYYKNSKYYENAKRNILSITFCGKIIMYREKL